MSLSLLLVSVAAANPALEAFDGVVLNFTGPNCYYCQQMSPIVAKLERDGYPIQKVDVTTHRQLFERMNVEGMPTFVLLVRGKEVTRRVGAVTEAELRRMLDQIPRRAEAGRELATAAVPPSRRDLNDAAGPAPQTGHASPAGSAVNDDSASRFEFPFPASGEERRPRVSQPALDEGRRAPPPIAPTGNSAPAPSGSPADWNRAVIRAQNDRTRPGPAATNDVPLASSTRIRVRDGGGTVYASATVIDSRPGRSILLTCGHVFRNLPRTAEIVVDVFVDGRPEQFRGQVIDHDLESDVGLLAIATSDPLPVSPIAADVRPPALGEGAYSIGCGGGDPPTRHNVRVTGFQRNSPPTYIECTGAPEQGRSGGGLFNAGGEIIGVCFAADAPQDRGLYASLASVHRLLDASGLSALYRRGREAPSRPAGNVAPPEFADNGTGTAAVAPEIAAATVNPDDRPPFAGTEPLPEAQPPFDKQPVAAAVEVPAMPEEAEVICIIRPRNQPAAASRVVVIHRASPKFMSFLTGELRRVPQETARRVGFDEVGSRDEPFSHFQIVAGTARPQTAAATEVAASSTGDRDAPRTTGERYRRRASSRVAWGAARGK